MNVLISHAESDKWAYLVEDIDPESNVSVMNAIISLVIGISDTMVVKDLIKGIEPAIADIKDVEKTFVDCVLREFGVSKRLQLRNMSARDIVRLLELLRICAKYSHVPDKLAELFSLLVFAVHENGSYSTIRSAIRTCEKMAAAGFLGAFVKAKSLISDYNQIAYLCGLSLLISLAQDKNAEAMQIALNLYKTLILRAKTLLDSRVLKCAVFFLSKACEDDLVSAFDGANTLILRSPEVTLCILSASVKVVTVDASTATSSFLENTIKAFKSTNELVRKSALELWSHVTLKAGKIPTFITSLLVSIINDKAASVEIRQLAVDAAKAGVNCPDILPQLVTLATKDSLSVLSKNILVAIHDHILLSDAKTVDLSKLCEFYLKHQDPLKRCQLYDLYLDSRDKNVWAADVLKQLFAHSAMLIHENSTSSLEETFKCLTILLLQHSLEAELESYVLNSKKNALLCTKKLKGKEETKAFLNCCLAAVPVLAKLGAPMDVWSLFLKEVVAIVSDATHDKDLLGLLISLFKVIVHDSLLVDISDKVPITLLKTVAADLTTVESLSPHVLKRIISALSSGNVRSEILGRRLSELVVLCNHPCICSQDGYYYWPGLVASHSLSPEELITLELKKLLQELTVTPQGTIRFNSLLNAISCSVLISPEDCGLIVATDIRDTIRSNPFSFSDQEIAIWRCQEGILFTDVLGKTITSPNQKSADKWEEQLREEMEKKRLEQAKYTNEEKALIDNQLALESDIRRKIEQRRKRLMIAFMLLECLKSGNIRSIQLHLSLISSLILSCCDAVCAAGLDELVHSAVKSCLTLADAVCSALRPISRGLIWSELQRRASYKNLIKCFETLNLSHEVQPYLERQLLLRKLADLPDLPLDSENFCFIFPFLHGLIRDDFGDDNQAVKKDVMELMAMHCSFGKLITEISPMVIQDCLFVIANFSSISLKAHAALSDLSSSIGDYATEEILIVLLDGIYSDEKRARYACLEALEFLDVCEALAATFATRVWISCFDEYEENCEIARGLWDSNEMEIGSGFKDFLLPLLEHDIRHVRECTARAFAGALHLHEASSQESLDAVFAAYENELKKLDDARKRRRNDALLDAVRESRRAVALTLQECAKIVSFNMVPNVLNFLTSKYGGLADPDDVIWEVFLNAGIELIDHFGQDNFVKVVEYFEQILETPVAKDGSEDRIREGVVILLGHTAKYFSLGDVRLTGVIQRLTGSISTPSESVQVAVCKSLTQLVKLAPHQIPELMEYFVNGAFNGPTYPARRGSSYGLAGIVKGGGYGCLREYRIMERIVEAVENKKSLESRQGALLLMETLCSLLGRQFEPQIVKIVPFVLASFGDTVIDVRRAAVDTAKVIMKNLSAYCMKLVLPKIIRGLDDSRWRTKVGSVEFLGTTAYLAPKLLTVNLPKIIPRLTVVLTDSHINVQKAAKEALQGFTDVIQNPEIKTLLPTLLRALADPSKDTETALNSMMKTSFYHYLDSPSLALVMPIVERGLKERSTDIKKKAAHIIGSLASITELSDIAPHLRVIVPLIREVLVDPVPEARAVTARSLGLLVQSFGEGSFPDLVEDLFRHIRSHNSRVDRQGCAQGLAEVLAALGTERLDLDFEGVLNEMKFSDVAITREGLTTLMIYIPTTFGEKFVAYLPRMIPVVVNALSDETEPVREAAMNALKVIIDRFLSKSVQILLPELENSLFDENYRLRLASLLLIGELLKKISGHVNAEEEGDSGRKAMMEALGSEKFLKLLGSLFVARSDSVATVRNTSLIIWKMVVVNTPKTVREILPHVIQIISHNLGKDGEVRAISISVLEDLSQKMSDIVESDLIPGLEYNVTASSVSVRQGAHLGLNQLVRYIDRESLSPETIEVLIKTLGKGLADESFVVREAAALCFDTYSNVFGSLIAERIVPPLLDEIQRSHMSNAALDALKQLMSIRGNELFPLLLSKIVKQDKIYGKHLGMVSVLLEATETIRSRDFGEVLRLIFDEKDRIEATEDEKRQLKAAFVSSIYEEDIHHLLSSLRSAVLSKRKDASKKTAFGLVQLLCENSRIREETDIEEWFQLCLRFIYSLETTNCLKALLARIKRDNLADYARGCFTVLQENMEINESTIGITAQLILPVFINGVLSGNSTVKEKSAKGIRFLAEKATPDMLKPFSVQLSGALIRILGDKFPAEVKVAMLEGLRVLLQKISAMLKPFMPQLQRSFTRCLCDDEAIVRDCAVLAIGDFARAQPKIETLLKEIEKGISGFEGDKQASMIAAMWYVLNNTEPQSLPPASRAYIGKMLEIGIWRSPSSAIRNASAICCGLFCARFGSLDVKVMQELTNSAELPEESARTGSALLIDSLVSYGLGANLLPLVLRLAQDKKAAVAEISIRSIGRLILKNELGDFKDKVVDLLVRSANHESNDVRVISLQVLCVWFRSEQGGPPEAYNSILMAAKERVVAIRIAGEQAAYAAFLLNGAELSKCRISENDKYFLQSLASKLDQSNVEKDFADLKRDVFSERKP